MIAFVLAFALLASPALAETSPPVDPPAGSEAEMKSVQAWGADHAECAEWSDACVVCTKDGCSTPGIACVPKETACRRK